MDSLAERMLGRLRAALELPHLRAPLDAAPGDEAAFARHATQLTADYAVIGASAMVVLVLVWWPIDWLVQPDPRFVEGFSLLRARGLGCLVLIVALFLGSSRVRRRARLVGPFAYAALLGCIGYSLGQMGGANLAWLADAIVATLPAALLPVRLGPRIAATLFIGLSLPAGFFLPFPETLRAPAAPVQLSFIVFSLVLTITVGEIFHRVLRRAFFQQRALGRARAELAEMNGTLASRVDAQTVELRALAGHLSRAQEQERLRISRELHDALGQELTAMRYTLARVERRRESDPEAVGVLVADLGALLDGTTAIVRSFLSELRPRVLDDLGLVAGAEWLCERVRSSGEIACRLRVEEGFPDLDGGLDPEIALILFRVLQEATTNARKHGGSRAVELTLRAAGDELTAEVRDDGRGFDPAAPSEGFGLLGIRERVRAAGGRLLLESSPGHGTRVAATVPSRKG